MWPRRCRCRLRFQHTLPGTPESHPFAVGICLGLRKVQMEDAGSSTDQSVCEMSSVKLRSNQVHNFTLAHAGTELSLYRLLTRVIPRRCHHEMVLITHIVIVQRFIRTASSWYVLTLTAYMPQGRLAQCSILQAYHYSRETI